GRGALAARDEAIEEGDRPAQPDVERCEGIAHTARLHAAAAGDLDLTVLDAGLAAKAADIERVGYRELLHHADLPVASALRRERAPETCFVADGREHTHQVLRETGIVRVPVHYVRRRRRICLCVEPAARCWEVVPDAEETTRPSAGSSTRS